jgi:hypothetical protein
VYDFGLKSKEMTKAFSNNHSKSYQIKPGYIKATVGDDIRSSIFIYKGIQGVLLSSFSQI